MTWLEQQQQIKAQIKKKFSQFPIQGQVYIVFRAAV